MSCKWTGQMKHTKRQQQKNKKKTKQNIKVTSFNSTAENQTLVSDLAYMTLIRKI